VNPNARRHRHSAPDIGLSLGRLAFICAAFLGSSQRLKGIALLSPAFFPARGSVLEVLLMLLDGAVQPFAPHIGVHLCWPIGDSRQTRGVNALVFPPFLVAPLPV
jgi:hypothetical protein